MRAYRGICVCVYDGILDDFCFLQIPDQLRIDCDRLLKKGVMQSVNSAVSGHLH
jgi:hypothetical protein